MVTTPSVPRFAILKSLLIKAVLATAFYCPKLILDVGYYGVLIGALWVGNSMADVKIVSASQSFGGCYGTQSINVSCPSGYVITSVENANLVTYNSTTNPTAINSRLPDRDDGGAYCNETLSVILICAKVCN